MLCPPRPCHLVQPCYRHSDITPANHCHDTLYAYTTAMRSPHLVGIQLAIQARQLAVHEVAGCLRLPHQQQLRQGQALLAGLDAPQAQVGLWRGRGGGEGGRKAARWVSAGREEALQYSDP